MKAVNPFSRLQTKVTSIMPSQFSSHWKHHTLNYSLEVSGIVYSGCFVTGQTDKIMYQVESIKHLLPHHLVRCSHKRGIHRKHKCKQMHCTQTLTRSGKRGYACGFSHKVELVKLSTEPGATQAKDGRSHEGFKRSYWITFWVPLVHLNKDKCKLHDLGHLALLLLFLN